MTEQECYDLADKMGRLQEEMQATIDMFKEMTRKLKEEK